MKRLAINDPPESALTTDPRGPVRSSVLAGLFIEPVSAFETAGGIDPGALSPEEAIYVERAIPKRVAEFAAGRSCAGRALEELSVSGFHLRVGASREPVWPPGIAGSITHTAGFCGAVAARKSLFSSLGIDAEREDAVTRPLLKWVTGAAEQQQLETRNKSDAVKHATLIFSAKEAFFKCQFPLTRQWVDFLDVSVSIEGDRFRIEPTRPLAIEALFKAPWTGRYSRYALSSAPPERNLIVTACSLPPIAASVRTADDSY